MFARRVKTSTNQQTVDEINRKKCASKVLDLKKDVNSRLRYLKSYIDMACAPSSTTTTTNASTNLANTTASSSSSANSTPSNNNATSSSNSTISSATATSSSAYIDNVNLIELKQFFDANYSQIYFIFYESFINVESNLKQKLSKINREELETVLFVFQVGLQYISFLKSLKLY